MSNQPAADLLRELHFPFQRFLFPVSCRLIWWAWGDLNLRPHAYQACALTG